MRVFYMHTRPMRHHTHTLTHAQHHIQWLFYYFCIAIDLQALLFFTEAKARCVLHDNSWGVVLRSTFHCICLHVCAWLLIHQWVLYNELRDIELKERIMSFSILRQTYIGQIRKTPQMEENRVISGNKQNLMVYCH